MQAPVQPVSRVATWNVQHGMDGRSSLVRRRATGRRRPHEVDDLLLVAGLRRVGAPPTYPAERPRLAIDVIAVRGLGCAAVLTPGPGISDHLPVAADLHVSPPDDR